MDGQLPCTLYKATFLAARSDQNVCKITMWCVKLMRMLTTECLPRVFPGQGGKDHDFSLLSSPHPYYDSYFIYL